MVIKWSDFAKSNLRDFVHYSKLSSPTTYVEQLVETVDLLKDQPRSGKVIFRNNNIETRQFIYEMHRIIYRKINDEIHIGAVLHMHYNLKLSIKLIQKFFE